MATHAKDCKWKDISISIYAYNDNLPDESITINSTYLAYSLNMQHDAESRINFNYCPICGCKLD